MRPSMLTAPSTSDASVYVRVSTAVACANAYRVEVSVNVTYSSSRNDERDDGRVHVLAQSLTSRLSPLSSSKKNQFP
jgi:hypothetical protein